MQRIFRYTGIRRALYRAFSGTPENVMPPYEKISGMPENALHDAGIL